MKTVALKQIGYWLEGEVGIYLWGGGQTIVGMYPRKILGCAGAKKFAAAVNDGGFGCESIELAQVYVYELYENGYKTNPRMIMFNSKQLKNAKRGI